MKREKVEKKTTHHARHAEQPVPDQIRQERAHERDRDLRHRRVVHVAEPGRRRDSSHEPERDAAERETQELHESRPHRRGVAVERVPRRRVRRVDDDAAQHEEEHVGRAVVEQRLEVDERAQALRQAGLFEHRDDGDGVGGGKHRAEEHALRPGPVVRERDADERRGQSGPQQHSRPGQEQGRREQAPHDVPLEGKRAGKEQDRQEAREEQVRVDPFPEVGSRWE